MTSLSAIPPIAAVLGLAAVLGALLVLRLAPAGSTGNHRRDRADATLDSLALQLAADLPERDTPAEPAVLEPSPSPSVVVPLAPPADAEPAREVWDPMPSEGTTDGPATSLVPEIAEVAPDPGAAYDALAASLHDAEDGASIALADLAGLAAAVRRGESVAEADPTHGPVTMLPAATTDAVQHDEPAALRRRAAGLRVEAHELAATDPAAARQACWEADLAAYDAVVIEAARRCGDTRLVSVRLRRRLALSLLGPHREPEALAATTTQSLADDVAGVRRVLAECLEPHERPALVHALGVLDLAPAGLTLDRAS